MWIFFTLIIIFFSLWPAVAAFKLREAIITPQPFAAFFLWSYCLCCSYIGFSLIDSPLTAAQCHAQQTGITSRALVGLLITSAILAIIEMRIRPAPRPHAVTGLFIVGLMLPLAATSAWLGFMGSMACSHIQKFEALERIRHGAANL